MSLNATQHAKRRAPRADDTRQPAAKARAMRMRQSRRIKSARMFLALAFKD